MVVLQPSKFLSNHKSELQVFNISLRNRIFLVKSSFPLVDATNLGAASLGKWIDHYCQKSLLTDVLYSVHALIKLAQAAIYYFSLFPNQLGSLKQCQCDWQLDQVQCKYQPGTNWTFQCLILATVFMLVIFSNHTELDNNVQTSQKISLLVKPRTRSDQDLNQWEMN